MRDDLTDEVKWEAVAQNDAAYDGLFFYGVKTTGIFCRPSCKAKKPKRENTVFFADTDEATKALFRPCKKCRPELTHFDPDGELIARVRKRFDEAFSQPHLVATVLQEYGVSANHFTRLFKQQTGFTPKQYLMHKRIAQAILLLDDPHMSVLAIAFACGFESLSSFYKSFKSFTGKTPTEYRR